MLRGVTSGENGFQRVHATPSFIRRAGPRSASAAGDVGRQGAAEAPAEEAGDGGAGRRAATRLAGHKGRPGTERVQLHSGDEGRRPRSAQGGVAAGRTHLRFGCSDFGLSGFRDHQVGSRITGPPLRLHRWLVPSIGCTQLRVLRTQPVEHRDPLPQRDCGRLARPSPRRRRNGKNNAICTLRVGDVNPTKYPLKNTGSGLGRQLGGPRGLRSPRLPRIAPAAPTSSCHGWREPARSPGRPTTPSS
jgi:hypothetical protein